MIARLARACFALAMLAAGSLPARASGPFDPFSVAGIDPRPGAQVPLDLPVRDEQGNVTTLRDLAQDKPIVLAPVLHKCPNICGVTLSGLSDALANQRYRAGNDFTVVAFGIDPLETAADAATAKAELLAQKSARLLKKGGFHAVTADASTVDAVAKALGYRYAFDDRIKQYAHVAATAVLTPDGRLTRWLYGISPQPMDLRLALTEAGKGRIGTLGDQILLLCYHYDPQTGRYNSLAWLLLRAGGGLTLAAMAVFLGLSLVRERKTTGGGAR